MKKRFEIFLLKIAFYIIHGRNVHRCKYISRKDNNRLYYDGEHLECIIKRMQNDYKDVE